MDNVTHTVFALTLARTPLARAGRGTTAALVLASNAPDIDAVSLAGGTASYLQWHRGPTHGIVGVPLLAVAVALVVWSWRRFSRFSGDPRSGDASFAMLFAVSLVGAVCHVLMDLPTSYGTRLLSPFAWTWFAADWLPIVDIYLLAILIGGLLVGAMGDGSRRRVATIALALMAANYGVRAFAHHQALTVAPRLFGPTLPQRCDPGAPVFSSAFDSWPRPTPSLATGTRPCLLEIAAMPTFISPFRWRVVARASNAYELHDVDLLDARVQQPPSGGEVFWRMAVRVPDVWTPAAVEAAQAPEARVFLGFSRFPATRSVASPDGGATVRWNDMRFAGGITSLTSPRPPDPFTVVVRLAPNGRVLEETLGR